MKTLVGTWKVAVALIATAVLAAILAAPASLFAASGSAIGPAATPEPIVGFWYVKLIAEGNTVGLSDGTVLDWGLQQWHSDGTEILNSGSGPGRFCLGVWAKGTGPANYVLNHFPLDYPDGKTLNILNLREKVGVSRDHRTMTGSFTFDVYTSGGTLLSHLIGKVEGHRITVGTRVAGILPPTP